MRRIAAFFIFLVALPGTSAVGAAPEPPIAPPTDAQRAIYRAALRAALEKSVSRIEANLTAGKKAIELREVSNGALARLLIDNDPAASQRLMKRVLASQDMDATDKLYGRLPWDINRSDISDDNSIEFGTQSWGPILLGYGDRISPEMKAAMLAHIPASLAALRRHPVKVSYTNIFLMKSAALILLGEASGDKAAADEGYAAFDIWLAYTKASGIREFGSPTYYATSMDSLANGFRYAARSGYKEKFRAALDFFWTDIGAHYFAGQESIGGPHSRDYDLLTGAGGTGIYMYAEGLRPHQTFDALDLEKISLAQNLEPGGYHPPPSVYALANLPERTVREKWDIGPGAVRYTFVTPDFAIGSTNGNYGPQDKMVNIEMGSRSGGYRRLPAITISPDDSDLPYGTTATADKSGHFKPHHLPLNLRSAQERGVLLASTDLRSLRTNPKATTLATNILLPAAVDSITIGDEKIIVPALTPFERPLSPGDVVGVREGNAAVVIRVFASPSPGDLTPQVMLKADPEGLKHAAWRIALYQARRRDGDPPFAADLHLRAAFFMIAAQCPDNAAYAALLKRAASASVTFAPGKDGPTATARVGNTILTADGTAAPVTLLEVNGREIGAGILDK